MLANVIQKRVIVKNGLYICPLCGKSHRSSVDAVKCSKICYYLHVLKHRVVKFNLKGKDVYACNICARKYPSKDLAASCASECLHDLLHSMGNLANEVNAILLRIKNKKLADKELQSISKVQAAVVAVVDDEPEEEKKVEELAAENSEFKIEINEVLPGEVSGASEPTIDQADKDTKSAAKPKDREFKPGENNKFYRDGAKYVCSECAATYFTKDDVLKCWNTHSSAA
jgi:hypothetical protein